MSSKRVTEEGVQARVQRAMNAALGDGALRARLNRALGRVNFELIVRPPTEVLEPEFDQFLARCEAYSMTSRERMYCVFQAARHVARSGVAGDVVECGVWRGGSSMMAALTLLAEGDARDMWLYDTFEGMVAPGIQDYGLHGEDPHAEWQRNERGAINEWCYAPLDEVQANMRGVGMENDRLHFVVGKVEETIPGTVPDQIAILRLDTDWYESTLHELTHLYPRLAPGGVLIIDDYGHWGGVRDAVDRYFAERGGAPLLGRVDYAGRMAVKPRG